MENGDDSADHRVEHVQHRALPEITGSNACVTPLSLPLGQSPSSLAKGVTTTPHSTKGRHSAKARPHSHYHSSLSLGQRPLSLSLPLPLLTRHSAKGRPSLSLPLLTLTRPKAVRHSHYHSSLVTRPKVARHSAKGRPSLGQRPPVTRPKVARHSTKGARHSTAAVTEFFLLRSLEK